MPSSPIPIVWAKLRPPVVPDRMVRRPRLEGILEMAGEPSLIAIVAPAGYGKTTAAAQLIDFDGFVAWFAVEPNDNEPLRFCSYVAAALCDAGLDTDLANAHLEDGPASIDLAIAALRAAIEEHDDPVTLVLDDLHVVENPVILQLLADFLRHPISNFTMVAVSRRRLALPVGRLRAQGRLAEFRSDQLAFDAVESALLLASMYGLDELSAEQHAVLNERTEGWPVGLALAGLALANHPDRDNELIRIAGDDRQLSEYLAVEVIEDLDDDTRAFVLATSILDTLDPELCDHVTGEHGSLAVLRRLLNDNVFMTALDDGATVFRHHPLFREQAHSLLIEEHPELLGTLHARASAWYERAGNLDGTIVHAIEAGESERACTILLDQWLEFAAGASFTELERWIRALGDDAKAHHGVALSMAWGLLNLGRHDEIEEWLATAAAAADSDDDARQVRLEGACIRGHAARHLGDVGALVAAAEDGLRHADLEDFGQPSPPRSRLVGASSNALVTAAAAAFWSDDLERCEAYAAAAVSLASAVNEGSSVVGGYLYLAIGAADAGDLERAEAHADQAMRIIGDEAGERFHRPTLGYVARAKIARERGRIADADAALDRAAQIEAVPAERLHVALIHSERALVHHALGERSEARAELREARRIAEASPDARFDSRLRTVENAIRFAAVAVDENDRAIPIGVRELTEKELAVLALLPHRLSRRDLASQLHVSENTIKTHLTAIRHKLAVPGRGDLVAKARELGLLSN